MYFLQRKGCGRYRFWSTLWPFSNHVWCSFSVHIKQVSSIWFNFWIRVIYNYCISVPFSLSKLWWLYYWLQNLLENFFRILLARLEYLRETFQIKEGDFLTFDALVRLSLSLSLFPLDDMIIWLLNFLKLESLVTLIFFCISRDKLHSVWAV